MFRAAAWPAPQDPIKRQRGPATAPNAQRASSRMGGLLRALGVERAARAATFSTEPVLRAPRTTRRVRHALPTHTETSGTSASAATKMLARTRVRLLRGAASALRATRSSIPSQPASPRGAVSCAARIASQASGRTSVGRATTTRRRRRAARLCLTAPATQVTPARPAATAVRPVKREPTSRTRACKRANCATTQKQV